jgi:DNA replication protein DnaC
MFDAFTFNNKYHTAHLSKLEHDPGIIQTLRGWIKNPKNILYFCGNAGNGKTYFAAAYYNYLKEHNKHVRAYDEKFLMAELKTCINLSDWSPDYRVQIICESNYLIIDDLGSTLSSKKEESEWKKDQLFHLLDLRYSSGLPTLITSNLCRPEVDKLFHERFSSRLYDNRNIVIEIHQEDRRKTAT